MIIKEPNFHRLGILLKNSVSFSSNRSESNQRNDNMLRTLQLIFSMFVSRNRKSAKARNTQRRENPGEIGLHNEYSRAIVPIY